VACREDTDENEETTKPGLPVPTAEIMDAVQQVLGLKPPPKLVGAVQKLINCCPEAQAALDAQVGAARLALLKSYLTPSVFK
jgi:hypothetical protein